MEVVLEIEHPNGTRSWHRLSEWSLTIGRSPASDLIIDDPFVDAHHARITRDEAGALVVEDLGSVNGIRIAGVREAGRVPIHVGTELRLGRTVVRFRDRHEVVAAALVDDERVPPHAAETAGLGRRVSAAPAVKPRVSGWSALLVASVAAGAYSVYAWLGSTERSSGGAVFGVVTALALSGAVWAGAWAVASRVNLHRFNYSGHIAVIAAASLGGLAVMSAGEWFSFLWPDAWLPGTLSTIGSVGLVALTIVTHLALASAMRRERRAKIGVAVAGVMLALLGGAALTSDDAFSDVPAFPSVLKPLAVGWIPTISIDAFGNAMKELKTEADSLVVVPATDPAGRP